MEFKMKILSTLFVFILAGFMLFSGSHKIAMEDNNSRVFTFANGDSMSSRIDLLGGRLAAIQFPAAFTGTQVLIYTSYDSASTRANLKLLYAFDASTKVLVPYVAGSIVGIDPKYQYYTYQYVWLKSLNVTVTITQTAARNGRAIIAPWD
jgi:hypothetical protein